MHEQFHESAAYKLESRAEGALILPMNEHTMTITTTADNETDRSRAGIGSRGGHKAMQCCPSKNRLCVDTGKLAEGV
jgi:hypothetical protein